SRGEGAPNRLGRVAARHHEENTMDHQVPPISDAADVTPTPERNTARRRQTQIIVGAVLGLSVCLPTMTYSYGIFMAAFETQFGWSRTALSVPFTVMATVIFVGGMPVGWLADRLRANRVAAASMAGLGLAFLAFPFVVRDLTSLWAAYGLASILGLGTIPAVLLKPLMMAFSKRRGLATGLALSGIGIGAVLLPQVANALVERGGYGLGYAGLGALCLTVSPLLLFLLSSPERIASGARAAEAPADGVTLLQASRTRTFWGLSAITALGVFGVAGMASQLVPFLRDYDVNVAKAADALSLFGLGSLAGRIGTGHVLDRLKGPLAGSLPFMAGAAGALLLLFFDARFAFTASIFMGFALGAEVDIVAYFVSRYFGLRYHGAIFGWYYGLVALGGAGAPIILAILRDSQGDYDGGLVIAIAALMAAALLCPLLGRYQYDVSSRQ
ncbi:MAG: MFS transporter, partial [Hyphomonadaceae bacterium]